MTGTAIDPAAHPKWLRTGYKFFPYAAQQSGHWWVLRLNHGFPEHDLYTVFVDGTAAADVTAGADNPSPLAASVGALKPADPAAEPALDEAAPNEDEQVPAEAAAETERQSDA